MAVQITSKNRYSNKLNEEEINAPEGQGMSTTSKVGLGLQVAKAMGVGSSGSESPTTDSGEGAMGGAMQGAMAGAATGNPYAAIGMAALGGITGAIGANSAKKAMGHKIEAQKNAQIAESEKEKELRKQEIYGKLGANIQGSLLRKI